MSRRTSKIHAFTLAEMMVVIVLSAIVAGLAFAVLDVVQKNMRSIETNYEHQSELQALEVAMTIDFNAYPTIFWNPKTDDLELSSPIEQQTYHFEKDSIHSKFGSFLVKVKSRELYFEGQAVTAGEIDAIKLTFENTRDLHSIFVYKYNDPTIQF